MEYKPMDNICCFTGHREITMPEKELQEKVADLIQKAIDKGYRHFICGGAVGFDMVCAEQILSFKRHINKNITLEIAVPCKDQDKYFTETEKARYNIIMEFADIVRMCRLPYNKYSMQLRNKYMVANSSLVIAYYENKSGGTRNTLDYANKKGVDVWYIK